MDFKEVRTMDIFGREVDIKHFFYVQLLPALVIIDLLLITVSIIFQIPNYVLASIQHFDLVICILLLAEYFLNLIAAPSKKDYIFNLENIVGLIASLPLEFIVPLFLPSNLPVTSLRYLRLLKIITVLNTSRFDNIKDLFRKTGFDKVAILICLTIAIFWILFCIFSTSYGPFDDLYFVIVTLTTVGYGDITPKTYNEKVLSMILILIGIIVFSTITATITTFFTDRILDDDDDDVVKDLTKVIDEKSDNIMAELESVRSENRQLRSEINELKETIDNMKK
ncbi:ion channel [uncultured Methanobrevibacter sp.]|uniref:ion channel n=1 Tax=uncultured Methanobrevibacter sp. TaxID=253161 RepID=UPI0025EDEAC4|nr:ion channel [uncultured Methanobrevibacter sp.]